MTKFHPRIRSRLAPDIHERLMAKASRPDMSVPKILNQALEAYFNGEVQDARDGAILRRLDLMSRHDNRHSRDMVLVQETIALFVQYFFTVMPEVFPEESDQRAAKGVSHFNDFLSELAGRMKSGGRTVKNALDDVLVTDEDFFTAEEIERFKSGKSRKKTKTKGKQHAPA